MPRAALSGLERNASELARAVFPLNEFYARAGVVLPEFRLLAGDEIPEPWRRQLVHDDDMTPTLEAYHGGEIHIEVLGRERRGDVYFREVILRMNRDRRPVEFGANRIALDLLPGRAREQVLEERLPFGHILKVHAVPHAGHPAAFFQVESDDLMNRAFGLAGRQILYGRRNTLRDSQGRALSEVVEILPPG